MRIEQLEQVQQIVSTKSLGKAAGTLFMSQPALSYSIKILEEELGRTLFYRTPKGMMLTPFGEEFLAYSQPIYQQWKMLQEMSILTDRETPTVFNVSCTYLQLPSEIFVELLDKYRNQGVYLNFTERPIQGVVEDLVEHRSEIGIISMSNVLKKWNFELFRQKNITYKKISSEQVYIIVGPRHPLYEVDTKQVTTDMLADYPLLCYGGIYHSFAPDYNLLGLDHPKNRINVFDRAAYNEILMQSDCYAVAIYSSNAYLLQKDDNRIRVLPMKNPLNGFCGYEVGWLKENTYESSEIAIDFLKKLQIISQNALEKKASLL